MRLVLSGLVAAALFLLPGCTECHPMLDVRHCRPDATTCLPTADDFVTDWNPDLASLWPDLARLLNQTPVGEHNHADWNQDQERTFWEFWHVPAEEPEKQIFLRHDGAVFRVRVLTCEGN